MKGSYPKIFAIVSLIWDIAAVVLLAIGLAVQNLPDSTLVNTGVMLVALGMFKNLAVSTISGLIEHKHWYWVLAFGLNWSMYAAMKASVSTATPDWAWLVVAPFVLDAIIMGYDLSR